VSKGNDTEHGGEEGPKATKGNLGGFSGYDKGQNGSNCLRLNLYCRKQKNFFTHAGGEKEGGMKGHLDAERRGLR